MGDLVECYAGSRYPERPRAFAWQGQRLEVAAVESEWQSPTARFFRVRTGNGQIFLLGYREADGAWTVEQLRRESV
jgi:hypothetical protein